ncbi:hypothetical protein BSL78_00529 [Apostichopus japonicus]|uniref:Uncharacterized protein n=1 Tax=Stichopus japonicus TaxID=307972 RepID=A0A2G8LQJ6_STIJA|nr:hypothetical protein BSL78_00529 [Apostichopus japonicus]
MLSVHRGLVLLLVFGSVVSFVTSLEDESPANSLRQRFLWWGKHPKPQHGHHEHHGHQSHHGNQHDGKQEAKRDKTRELEEGPEVVANY